MNVQLVAKAAFVALALIAVGCQSTKPFIASENPDFYIDGNFSPELAKQSYYAMMEKFGYPIYPTLKTENLWVCDFVQGKNAQLGMGGVFWINESGEYGKSGTGRYTGKFAETKFGYLGHEIFCLPNQAVPEHRHIGGEKGYGPKMEAWQIRYGEAYFFSEVVPEGGKEMLIKDMPKEEQPWGFGEPWFKCNYVIRLKAGDLYRLQDPESYHFLRGGKDGCIITEYATFHNHVEFSKPGMTFANTGSK